MHSSRPDFGPSTYEEGGDNGSRRPSRDSGAGVGGSHNSRWWSSSSGGHGNGTSGSHGISGVSSIRDCSTTIPIDHIFCPC